MREYGVFALGYRKISEEMEDAIIYGGEVFLLVSSDKVLVSVFLNFKSYSLLSLLLSIYHATFAKCTTKLTRQLQQTRTHNTKHQIDLNFLQIYNYDIFLVS